jgi:CRISPR-associated endonuclease Cas1
LQATVTADTPLGSSIARGLIGSKIKGQIEVLKELGYRDQAAEAGDYATQITPATNISDLLGIEGTVAKIFWRSTADIPVQFGPRQPIPDHWKTFGSRHSTLTGTNRAAITPGNAMLNYLYGVLASEITIALHAIWLDPAFGTLHADKDDRASLAYDLMEPARPILDRWFFHWLQSATFSKRDFFEDYRGQIRLMRPLNSHLAMTAALWREIADQLAQWFYQRLIGKNASLRLKFVDLEIEAGRRAKRWALGNALQRPVPTTCMECGKALPNKRRKFCSDACAKSYHGGELVYGRLAKIAPAPTGISAIIPLRKLDEWCRLWPRTRRC